MSITSCKNEVAHSSNDQKIKNGRDDDKIFRCGETLCVSDKRISLAQVVIYSQSLDDHAS